MKTTRARWYVGLAVIAVLGAAAVWAGTSGGTEGPSLETIAGQTQDGADAPGQTAEAQREVAPDSPARMSLEPVGLRFTVEEWDIVATRQSRDGVDSETHLIDLQERSDLLAAAGQETGEVPGGSTVTIETGQSATRQANWAAAVDLGEGSVTTSTVVGADRAEGSVISLHPEIHVVSWTDRTGEIVTVTVEGMSLDEAERRVLDKIVELDPQTFADALSESVFMPGVGLVEEGN